MGHGLNVRGDSVYCPLSFSLDSYWNCLTNCHHCYLRRLNRTWGQDLRPTSPEELDIKLRNGVLNKNPKSPIAHCLANKKTIRWGNKTDPFQKIELQKQVSKKIFEILIKHNWSFVIQTMHTDVLLNYESLIFKAAQKKLITIMPVVSPGLERDWEILERKRTNSPLERLEHLSKWIKQGIPGGINGEPFIPGFHKISEFEDAVKLLKNYNIKSYNTYNLHFNDHVAKNFHSIGLDIEKIWFMNQDRQWKRILRKLMEISQKHNIILGCPDFVNTGPKWIEKANTCCGINVPTPTTFNTHFWKKKIQEGVKQEEFFDQSFDGSGDYEEGKKIVSEKSSKFYTLFDSGVYNDI